MSFCVKKKAEDNFDAAKTLKDYRLYDAAASRLYYSVFMYPYEMLVEIHKVLAPENIDRKHAVVRDFLKNNIDKDQLDKFKEIFDLRVQADYYQNPVSSTDLKNCLDGAITFKNYILRKKQELEKVEYEYPFDKDE